MTSLDRARERTGSGFISRDHDDPTAEATFHFMRKAGLDELLSLMENLRVIVLVGRKAERARSHLDVEKLPISSSLRQRKPCARVFQ
jgi:hypothetical protein